jgi:molybdate transport system substrate-binding protein
MGSPSSKDPKQHRTRSIICLKSYKFDTATMTRINFLRLLALLLLSVYASAEEQISIAAAADLQSAMPEIAARFEKETGIQVKLSFGSSGNFFAQIQNGAPYDVFLSADVDYPKKLEATGLTETGSLYQYASGKIVLWIPSGSTVNVNRGLDVLLDPAVKKVAIANPAHAPYGRAAESALRKAGVWDRISSKLVLGENISQTAQFVQSGNADAGILALSLVLAPAMKGKGSYFLISQEGYPLLQQTAVVLKGSAHRESARRFLDFLKTSETQSLLRQYGFSTREAGR